MEKEDSLQNRVLTGGFRVFQIGSYEEVRKVPEKLKDFGWSPNECDFFAVDLEEFQFQKEEDPWLESIEENYESQRRMGASASYVRKLEMTLGVAFFFGWGVPQDYIRAMKYFTQSETLESAIVPFVVLAHGLGLGVVKDLSYAESLLKSHEIENNPLDLWKEGSFCPCCGSFWSQNGSFPPVDCLCCHQEDNRRRALRQKPREPNEEEESLYASIDSLEDEAELGDPFSILLLGERYFKGIGVPQDLARGVQYYIQGAKLHDPACAQRLGFCFENGVVLGKSQETALHYYKFSAEAEHPAGSYALARYYEWEIPPQLKLAAKYYKKALEQGSIGAKLALVRIYSEGKGVKQDVAKAFQMLEELTEDDFPPAFVELGCWHLEGRFIEKNLEEAYRCFKIAYDFGEETSIYQLGQCYFHGIGVKRDNQKALDYFRQGAKLELPSCLARLGACLLGGSQSDGKLSNDDLYNDVIEGLDYTIRSNNLHQDGGLYLMGEFYRRGIFVKKNPVLSKTKYWESAQQGNPFARQLTGD